MRPRIWTEDLAKDGAAAGPASSLHGQGTRDDAEGGKSILSRLCPHL